MHDIIEHATHNGLLFEGGNPMPTMQGSAPNSTLLHFRSR
jgi:hypothetical protein